MSSKRVFITGVTGFVGRHIAEYFHRKGFEVSGLVRNKQKFADAEIPFVRPVWGDLSKVPAQDLEGVNYFIHVAGVISAKNRAGYFDVNVEGTKNFIGQIKNVNPDFERFLFISSLAAAGPSVAKPRSSEELENPVSFYGQSKNMGEKEVEKSISSFTIMRPPVLFGPYDRGMLLPFQYAGKYGIAPMVGKGSSQLDFLYIDDFVRSCYDAILSPAAAGNKYFLGGNPLTWREFWTLMKEASGKKLRIISIPPAIVKGLGYINDLTNSSMLNSDKVKEITSPNWTSDCREAARDFNFKRQVGNLEAVSSTFKWYKQKGWL
jgi:nucleoside-diphosphate-sugar epimerase